MSALKHRLYQRLQLAAHRVQKAADRGLIGAAQVTTAQAAVLAVIAAAGSATQREVAGQLGLNESAITAMATRLLRLDLVRRERDPADPRAWRLQLSDKGRDALARSAAAFEHINGTLESVLQPDELSALAEYLQRIQTAFGD